MRAISGWVAGLATVTAIWCGLALSATPASAQAPAPPGVFKWTGFYVGANLGGTRTTASNSLSVQNDSPGYFFPPAIPGVEASGSSDLDNGGVIGGVQGGYNFQIGKLVLGFEVDFNWLEMSSRRGGTFRYTTNNSPYTLTTNETTDWLLTARPRVGWALDRWLPYLTVGFAATHSNFHQTFTESPFTPNPGDVSDTRMNLGWTVGTGVEVQVGAGFTLKGEYLFAQLDGSTSVGQLNALGRGATFSNSLSHRDIHIIRVGLNYLFN
jgi:outer membrane immunogenic protein